MTTHFRNIVERAIPGCHTQQQYRDLRTLLRHYGVNRFRDEMTDSGAFSSIGTILPSEGNPFARAVERVRTPCAYYDTPCNDFVVIENKDPHRRHHYVCPRYNEWTMFNVLTLGINDDIEECVDMLDRMEAYAFEHASISGWSRDIAMYFHCYPFNSIQTLHMHVVDELVHKEHLADEYANTLRLEDVRNVLVSEM